MEIYLHSMFQQDFHQMHNEITAQEAQIDGLCSCLNQLISALPETEWHALAFVTHNQQTHPLIPSLPYELLSDVFEKDKFIEPDNICIVCITSLALMAWSYPINSFSVEWHLLISVVYSRRIPPIPTDSLGKISWSPSWYEADAAQFTNPNNCIRKRLNYLNSRQNLNALSTDFLMSFHEPIVNHCLQA